MNPDGGIEVQFDSYAGRIGEEDLSLPQQGHLLHAIRHSAIVEASYGFGEVCALERDVAEPAGMAGRSLLLMKGGQVQQRIACGIQLAAGGVERRALTHGETEGPGVELGQRVEFIQRHADVVVIDMRHGHADIRLSIDVAKNTRRGLRC
jgi:hypothetical protein